MGADIHYEFQVKKNNVWETIDVDYEITRNYELFSWLAGVRGSLDPIKDPCGLPDDFDYDDPTESGELDETVRWFGEHSQTWYNLDEIIGTESPVGPAYGVISIEDYKAWDKESEPAIWYEAVHGKDVFVDYENDISGNTTHVHVVFTTDLSNDPEYLDIRNFIECCKAIKSKHSESRIVMGFDS